MKRQGAGKGRDVIPPFFSSPARPCTGLAPAGGPGTRFDPRRGLKNPVTGFINPPATFFGVIGRFKNPLAGFKDPVRGFKDPPRAFFNPPAPLKNPAGGLKIVAGGLINPATGLKNPPDGSFRLPSPSPACLWRPTAPGGACRDLRRVLAGKDGGIRAGYAGR